MANSVTNANLAEEIKKSLTEGEFELMESEDVLTLVKMPDGNMYIVDLEQEHEDLPIHVVVSVMVQARENTDAGQLLSVANDMNDMFVQGKVVVDADNVVRMFVAEAEPLIEDFPSFFEYAFNTISVMAATLMNNHGDLFDEE